MLSETVKAKTRTAVFVTLLIAGLIVAGFDVAKILADEEWRQYVAKVQQLFDDAKAKFEEYRNVTISHSVTLHVITKQQATDWWGHPSGEQDLTRLYRQEKIFKGLFMMPEEDTLVQATTEWTANWVAATVGDNDIYVIKENFNPYDKDAETTLVHEWTHIWQPDLTSPQTYSEDKAHAALVEGDARFMEAYYRNMTSAKSQYIQASVLSPAYLLFTPLLGDVYPMSNTLWSIDFFPYDKGEIFVEAVYDSGGFQALNQAYVKGYTPSSTAQILHPEKYFANETAQQVQTPTFAENNWTLIQTDYKDSNGNDMAHNTYGEFFIQAMLDAWLDGDQAQKAAEGWVGDNFAYYERGSDYLYTWRIQWTNGSQAEEFNTAFHDMMNQTGASEVGSSRWLSNEHYLVIDWNYGADSTLIAVSNLASVTQPSYFS